MKAEELANKAKEIAEKANFTAGQVCTIAFQMMAQFGLSERFLKLLEKIAHESEFAEVI